METKKQEWIDETFNSIEGIGRVSISDVLKQKLEAIPVEIKIVNIYIPMRTVWLAAASILILITLNVAAIRNNQKQVETESVSSYFDYMSSTNELL